MELATTLAASNNKNIPKAALPRIDIAQRYHAAITAKIAALNITMQRMQGGKKVIHTSKTNGGNYCW